MVSKTIRMGKNGTVAIPKEIRDLLGIKEGTVLKVEIADNAVIIRPLRPRRVKIGERIQKIVEEMKREELELEG
jgi:AbrB family looped-hinge helix DNA binding protein